MFKSRTLELLVFCIATLSAAALAQSVSPQPSYSSAMKMARLVDRIRAMEQVVSSAPAGPLRHDALEVLAWDYLQTGNSVEALRRADELQQLDPGNPLAFGIISEFRGAAAPAMSAKQAKNSPPTPSANALQRPQEMTTTEFEIMRLRVGALLDGAAGLALLNRQDYKSARPLLERAVAARPDDPRYLYALAVAMLSTDKEPSQKAYMYLARAVDLTRGTPAGEQIAQYARDRYLKDGGTSADWDRYLVSAAPASPAPARSQSPVVYAQAPPPAIPTQPAQAPSRSQPPATTQTARNTPAPVVNIPAPARSPLPSRTEPMSLGIVIQAAELTPENRKAIIYALSDLVRHLRENDEAFLLSYGEDLEFVEDLTANANALDEGLDRLQHAHGTALLDAVAFSAGHLKRIARNKNRAVLVISDGKNRKQENPWADLAELKGVRVDCIGLDVDDPQARSELQSLASNSGGRVSFASDPAQFRAATFELARSMGIDFPR